MPNTPVLHLRRLQSVVREVTGKEPSMVHLVNCLLSEMGSGLRFERDAIQRMSTRLMNWDVADGVILRHKGEPVDWPGGKTPRVDVEKLYRIYTREALAAGYTPFSIASFRIRAYELTKVED